MNTNELIPFGKYKGQPLEVLMTDEKYLEWLSNQEWFRTTYPIIYKTVVINHFNEPQDTPEHNQLQAKFLNKDFILKLLTLGLNLEKNRYDIENIRFEYKGNDVIFDLLYPVIDTDGSRYWGTLPCCIEIKPTIGDEYPAILRQVQQNSKGYYNKIVYTTKYNGSVDLESVKKIFGNSDIHFIVDGD